MKKFYFFAAAAASIVLIFLTIPRQVSANGWGVVGAAVGGFILGNASHAASYYDAPPAYDIHYWKSRRSYGYRGRYYESPYYIPPPAYYPPPPAYYAPPPHYWRPRHGGYGYRGRYYEPPYYIPPPAYYPPPAAYYGSSPPLPQPPPTTHYYQYAPPPFATPPAIPPPVETGRYEKRPVVICSFETGALVCRNGVEKRFIPDSPRDP